MQRSLEQRNTSGDQRPLRDMEDRTKRAGTFLAVPVLGDSMLPIHRDMVPSLVRELGSHIPHSATTTKE